MPAAAVIPAPIAYVNAVAVKTFVVEFRMRQRSTRKGVTFADFFLLGIQGALY